LRVCTFGSARSRLADRLPAAFNVCDHETPVNGSSARSVDVIRSYV
jgi:hypothetical protein